MKQLSNKQQSGFTLIELVIVIAILGILSAVALPKFVDLSGSAKTAAVQGVAGAITSAFFTNAAAVAVGVSPSAAISGAALTVSLAAGSVLAGGLPSGYTLSPATASCTGVGGAIALTVSGATAGQAAAATLICTG